MQQATSCNFTSTSRRRVLLKLQRRRKLASFLLVPKFVMEIHNFCDIEFRDLEHLGNWVRDKGFRKSKFRIMKFGKLNNWAIVIQKIEIWNIQIREIEFQILIVYRKTWLFSFSRVPCKSPGPGQNILFFQLSESQHLADTESPARTRAVAQRWPRGGSGLSQVRKLTATPNS